MEEEETNLLIRLADPNSNRKTAATVVAAIDDGEIINLDTQLFSKLFPYIINKNPEYLQNWKIIRSEVTVGSHRIDYLLEDPEGNKVYAEVKSTTRVIDGIACFPDAVSKRATQHLQILKDLSNEANTLVIFTVYKQADYFEPCKQIDPVFTKTYYETQDQIDYLAIQLEAVLERHKGGYRMYIYENGLIETR